MRRQIHMNDKNDHSIFPAGNPNVGVRRAIKITKTFMQQQNSQIGSIKRELESTRKYQMYILKLKSSVYKIKNSVDI